MTTVVDFKDPQPDTERFQDLCRFTVVVIDTRVGSEAVCACVDRDIDPISLSTNSTLSGPTSVIGVQCIGHF
jgi:hypothetical protein